MILIFSSSANGSKQIHREVQQAFDGGKPVVPFRIESVIPEKSLRYYMGSVHWLDALTPPLEQHLQKLTQSVSAFLRAKEPGEEQREIKARGIASKSEAEQPATEQARRREDEKLRLQEKKYQRETAAEAEAVEFNPKLAAPYKGRGFWWHKGTPDRAIADCTEAIRLDPKSTNEYYNRGFAWWQKGDPDQAIADWTEAIRLDPKYANAFNNRGIAWWQKDDLDKATADWTEAIRLDPRNAPRALQSRPREKGKRRPRGWRGRHCERKNYQSEYLSGTLLDPIVWVRLPVKSHRRSRALSWVCSPEGSRVAADATSVPGH
jgi:tetratricopeptide (TPR) repeat protein